MTNFNVNNIYRSSAIHGVRVGSRAVTKNIDDALSESRHKCDFKDVGE